MNSGRGVAVHSTWTPLPRIEIELQEVGYTEESEYQSKWRRYGPACGIVHRMWTDQLYTTSAGFECAAAGREHTTQPLAIGAVRECNSVSAGSCEDADRVRYSRPVLRPPCTTTPKPGSRFASGRVMRLRPTRLSRANQRGAGIFQVSATL